MDVQLGEARLEGRPFSRLYHRAQRCLDAAFAAPIALAALACLIALASAACRGYSQRLCARRKRALAAIRRAAIAWRVAAEAGQLSARRRSM